MRFIREIDGTDVYDSADTVEGGNEQTLRDQAEQALAVNRAFVASTPNQAQTLAHVKALSRQSNGIIRLLLDRLDGTD
jgi:hypothetical protein